MLGGVVLAITGAASLVKPDPVSGLCVDAIVLPIAVPLESFEIMLHTSLCNDSVVRPKVHNASEQLSNSRSV